MGILSSVRPSNSPNFSTNNSEMSFCSMNDSLPNRITLTAVQACSLLLVPMNPINMMVPASNTTPNAPYKTLRQLNRYDALLIMLQYGLEWFHQQVDVSCTGRHQQFRTHGAHIIRYVFWT